MAQDYSRTRRSSNRRKAAEPRVPAWVWLFTGCVLGAFVMFLMRLSELDPVQKVASKGSDSSASTRARQSEQPNQPKFDFYELLKETRVSVPEIPHADDKTKDAQNTSGQENFEYILQVASFKNVKDAEQLKVELILLNLEARIEQANVREGETWNRVLVGPFESRSLLAKARSTLVSHNHAALVLKRPKAQG